MDDYVIFKGKKTGSLDALNESPRFPITLQVVTPYYGSVAAGQTIVMREILGTVYHGDDVIMPISSGDLEKIEDNVEYVFILRKTADPSTGEEYYTYVSRNHTFSKTADRVALAKKMDQGVATELEKFRSSVLETYLGETDTKLDLYEEASKFVNVLSETATEEEILNALPTETKALFEAMIEQYGTK
ncbi:MAG: hypothetical protein IJ043_03555 [Clostridia bacterium]|nr:hypothetical protein [Clostridia bacterium]